MKPIPVHRPASSAPPVSGRTVARSARPVRGASAGGASRSAFGRGRNGPLLWIGIVGVAALVVAVLAITVLRPGSGGPKATANPAASPAGSGVTATITTKLGTIVMEVYDQSAPIAATNFLKLADAGFYNGLTFHRLVPDFVIQGGDPAGNGSGGPGYTIQDEPVVGQYGRGIVAMARTSQPNSQGSQFFIVLNDSAKAALEQFRTYVIFGKVISGMDVVDAIGAMPNSGSASGNAAINPVVMTTVTVTRP
jgi:cyclophilin family peptidyl-prolyl cis-trans isomerase